MERAQRILALGLLAVALAACGAGDEAADPALPRQPLRPTAIAVPEAVPSTTATPVDTRRADHVAQTELRAVLAAAEEWYAENGTFDGGLGPVAELTDGITVVALGEVAGREGVAYDAFGSRLTLHRQSASGIWFCIDVRGETIDHGFGDSFQQALATCTDGVTVGGWGDAFSPTGPDEAAINGVIRAFLETLATGSANAAHDLFSAEAGCQPEDLSALWPEGLVLADSADYELSGISVAGEAATATFSSQVLGNATVPVESLDGGWRLGLDPCDLLGPVAAGRMDTEAKALLEEGLVAVRSAFVIRSDFAFGSSVLAADEPAFTFVPSADTRFGTLSYSGNPAAGLLITEGSPGRFYCAVESLSALTVYGEGDAATELDTPARCRARATG